MVDWQKMIAEKGETTVLMQASGEGNTEIVKLVLEKGGAITDGVDVDSIINSTDDNQWTALMMASCQGHNDTVEYLLSKGADLTITDESGRNAIMLASCFGYPDTVKLLLLMMNEKGDDGADMLTMTDENGETALMIASNEGQVGVVQLLLDTTADSKITTSSLMMCNNHDDGRDGDGGDSGDSNELTLTTTWALDKELDDITKHLLDNNETNRQIADHYGWTALSFAARTGNFELVKLLMTKPNNANVNLPDQDGSTAFMYAARGGHDEMVEYMLRNGNADITLQDEDGDTALFYASLGGHTSTVKLLSHHGAYAHLVDKNGWTALMYASDEGHLDTVQFLKEEMGIDASHQDHANGDTALSLAHRGGHTKVVEYLLGLYDDKSTTNSSSSKVDVRLLEWVRFLMNSKAILEHVDIDAFTTRFLEKENDDDCSIQSFINWKNDAIEDGRTMLLCAIGQKRFDIAKLLLEHGGADPKIPDSRGWTALMLACTRRKNNNEGGDDDDDDDNNTYMDMLKLLTTTKQNADNTMISIENHRGDTALTVACREGNAKAASFLIKQKGANVTIAELMISAYQGRTEVLKLLLSLSDNNNNNNLTVSSTDNNGKTPLMWASRWGQTQTVKLLLEQGADIAAQDQWGMTALMSASEGGHLEIVKILLLLPLNNKSGAAAAVDPNIENEDGETALSLAMEAGHSEIVKLLMEHGAVVKEEEED